MLDMNVRDKAGAISEAGYRIQKGRAKEIADLYSGMVLTVSECWDFYDTLINRGVCPEFLREYRMSYIDVEKVGAAICDSNSEILSIGKISIKVRADRLNGRGIDRFANKWLTETFYPNPSRNLHMIVP